MLKTFPIDFIRAALEQTLYKEHLEDVNLYGGKSQVNILSFYEQLKAEEDIGRFVETYRDLTEQQNRSGLILNGVVISPENPAITNIYSSLIIPLTWTCSLRCTVKDRDQSIITINNLIEKLKGKKVDIAQLQGTQNGGMFADPFIVGTLGQGIGEPTLKNGDFVGQLSNATDAKAKIDDLIDNGLSVNKDKEYLVYIENDNQLKVARMLYNGQGEETTIAEGIVDSISVDQNKVVVDFVYYMAGDYSTKPDLMFVGTFTLGTSGVERQEYSGVRGTIVSSTLNGTELSYVVRYIVDKPSGWTPTNMYEYSANAYQYAFDFGILEDDGTIDDIVFPPQHESFEKYKLSFSFDAIRCDEPRNLNAEEYCELTFSGNATLVNESVQLGNDLLKISIQKLGYMAETYVSFDNAPIIYLEPLEMPSGSNANTLFNQLTTNKFMNKTHTDALGLTLQYTFIFNNSISLLKQWFDYARYGTQGLGVNYITPNLEYGLSEYWCSWGVFENKHVKTKITNSIDVDNTESDTLTLSLTMQIQGV